jgi:hypothetical protein
MKGGWVGEIARVEGQKGKLVRGAGGTVTCTVPGCTIRPHVHLGRGAGQPVISIAGTYPTVPFARLPGGWIRQAEATDPGPISWH